METKMETEIGMELQRWCFKYLRETALKQLALDLLFTLRSEIGISGEKER